MLEHGMPYGPMFDPKSHEKRVRLKGGRPHTIAVRLSDEEQAFVTKNAYRMKQLICKMRHVQCPPKTKELSLGPLLLDAYFLACQKLLGEALENKSLKSHMAKTPAH